jgi:hypothetical protein
MKRERVVALFEESAKVWRAHPKLHRKNYLYDPEAGIAGGVDLPQLLAYAGLISARGGKPVRRIAINWMNDGMISVASALQEENA